MDNISEILINHRDTETGEPFNYTWVSMSVMVNGDMNIKTDKYYFKDIPTIEKFYKLPSLARGGIAFDLWKQWWEWKNSKSGGMEN
jgi:hypothetical protein